MEPDESDYSMDSSIESVFLTGSLDELRVCFSSSNQVSLKTLLLSKSFSLYVWKMFIAIAFSAGPEL